MSLIEPITFGKGFFEGSTLTDGMCQGCLLRRGEHIHHKAFKAMGGRKGTAKTKSEDAANKIRLCEVCHRATHGLTYIASDGFSCKMCPRRTQCYFGARVSSRAFAHLDPPW